MIELYDIGDTLDRSLARGSVRLGGLPGRPAVPGDARLGVSAW
ncbi:hypothetical protein [Micromonospora cathayae]|uniref:Uncharacterized protein n=1 Tax=Micromonospora cathayae TaxID=3028804 RepID=A0ABY7ZHH0_9ACTN|nr:hypothetical protein [Micromonospora sp. HUAS 3]WDZ82375.1 hypothetical protein PVK37_17930 [Micromonospora sp. HUAS 3]